MGNFARFIALAFFMTSLCGCGRLFFDDGLAPVSASSSAVTTTSTVAASAGATHRIFFFGGLLNTNTAGGNQVWSSTDTGVSWANESTFPYGAEWGFGTAIMSGKIIVAGGVKQDFSTYYTSVYSTTDGVTWTPTGNLPGARTHGSLVAHGTDLYWIGGINNVGTTVGTIYKSTDEGANWSTCGQALGVAAQGGHAYSVGGFIFWVGGEAGGYYNFTQQSGANPCTDAWTFDTNLPISLARYSGTVFNGKIYVVAGETSLSVTQDDVYEGAVSAGNVTWTTYSNVLPSPAGMGGGFPTRASLIVVGTKMVLIGGLDVFGGATAAIYESNDGQTWSAVSGAALPFTRGGGGAAAFAL